jgi:hypothetical protein
MACNQLKGDRSLERFRWIVAFRRRGMLPFTKEQIVFLLEAGFDLAAHLPLKQFWFEEAGLSFGPRERDDQVAVVRRGTR